jgi:spoIIIJ-associated protein
MDENQIEQGKQWLEGMLQLSGLSASVAVDQQRTEQDGSCWLTIEDADLSPEQTQVLLGRDGDVLDAVQYLVNTILNIGRGDESQTAYTVELAGYRVQRQMELQRLADQAAQQARETGEESEMAALSAAERRQVHTYLKSTYADLETYSRGKEPDRRLVVRLLSEEEPGET